MTFLCAIWSSEPNETAHLNLTRIRYNVYAVLPMKNSFITVLYKLTYGPVIKSTYLVRKTTRYRACVLKDIPRHERDVWILCRRMNIEARWDRSPKNRKIFILAVFGRSRPGLRGLCAGV